MAHHVADFSHPLNAAVLPRCCKADRGAVVEPIAESRIETLLAHRPGEFLDLFGGRKEIGQRGVIRARGGFGSDAARVATGHGRCELCPGAGDDTGHLHKLGAQALVIVADGRHLRHRSRVSARSCRDPLDRGKQLRGIGLAVAAGIFGQEPAPPLGREHGSANRLEIRLAGRRHGRRGSSVCLGGVFGGHEGRDGERRLRWTD
jgi:hypothetical protein